MVGQPPFHILARRGDVAERVIAVGDPGRVRILSEMLEDVRIVNEHRGLLTVTGSYRGVPVTVATHGMGGASAAIVFEELGMLGAKTIVRLGTTGGMVRDMGIGDIVVATGAAYPRGGNAIGQYVPDACMATSPSPRLTTRIIEKLYTLGEKPWIGPVFSSDAFYAEDPGFAEKWSRRGVIAVEMECAALFGLGWMRGWETACVLIVSDNLLSEKQELATSEELRERINKAAKAVLEVFAEEARGRQGN